MAFWIKYLALLVLLTLVGCGPGEDQSLSSEDKTVDMADESGTEESPVTPADLQAPGEEADKPGPADTPREIPEPEQPEIAEAEESAVSVDLSALPADLMEPAEEPVLPESEDTPEDLPEDLPVADLSEPVQTEILIPYHRTAYHAVPHDFELPAEFQIAAAILPVPLKPLSYPLGGEDNPALEKGLALIPDRKEDLIPRPEQIIEPPSPEPGRDSDIESIPVDEGQAVPIPEKEQEPVIAVESETGTGIAVAEPEVIAAPVLEPVIVAESEPEPEVVIEPGVIVILEPEPEPEPEVEATIEPDVVVPPAVPLEPVIVIEPEDAGKPDIVLETEPETAAEPEDQPAPEPEILYPGPRLTIDSPRDNSYYRSSFLLKGFCRPSPEAPEETRDIKSMTWRMDALGDYDNTVFLEEDGSFELDVFTAGLEGPHQLSLVTEDFGGRKTRQVFTLNDGNQPPQIILEYPGADGLYGSMLSVMGDIKDMYRGIPELEGIQRLSYSLIPRDRDTGDTVLSGDVPVEADNSFLFALDMEERSGRQSLRLDAEGVNGSVGSLEISLVPGGSEIPSFSIKPQDGRLILSWEPVPGVEEQTLYLTDDGSLPSDNAPGNQFSGVKSPLVLGGVYNGRHYRARLKVKTDGREHWSHVAEAVPLAPGTLELKAEGRFEQILLTWKAVPGASSFRIFRREENETDFILLEDPVEGTSYVDAAVEFGRNYYYRIEPSGIAGPLSYEVPAAMLEAPSEKITMSSHYRDISAVKLTVSGEYAYVAAGETGFYIMDVSTPQKPETIGHMSIPGVEDVYIDGEYAYLAAGSHGFSLINIAEPTRPFTVLSRATDNAQGIAARENIVFIADGERGLQIFDITNRQDPRRLGTFRDTPAYQLALKDEKLYIATGNKGLIVLDISNLSDPRLLQEYTETAVFDVMFRAGRLYLACGEEGMIILDENPEGYLFELSRFRSHNARMVRLWEDYAMIADGTGGMKAVDISLPEKPQLFGSFPGNDTLSIAMAEDYALIADVSGLKVVRTYLYGQSVHELSLATAGKAYGVMLEGSSLWVADRRGGVAEYDVSNPLGLNEGALKRVFPSDYAEDLLLKDGKLYVADGPSGVKVYDRIREGNPLLASMPVSGRARRILPYGSSIAVVTTGDGVMFLNEKNDNGELSLHMSRRIYYPDVRDAAFYGSYLFIGDHEEGLIIMDAGLEGAPVTLDILPGYEGIRQLMIRGDVLYVLHRRGISLLNIRNPEHPVPLSEIQAGEAEGIQMDGSMLYVARGFRGVAIYRINENHQALKISDCEDIFAVDVAPAGAYAYYADMEGIGVLRVLVPDWLE